jgi:hypothetical protein
VAYCEGGRFEGARGRGKAFDNDGKLVKDFRGNSGNVLHQANFIDAVRAQDRSILNADVAVGNDSTGWCNLANVAVQAGIAYSQDRVESVKLDKWTELMAEMGELAKTHGLSMQDSAISLSPMLTLDQESEQFVGEYSKAANQLLRRRYRPGYEVPEIKLETLEPVGG